jgi:hypothetical protein
MIWQGEQKAWEILSALDSKAVEASAGAAFDPDNSAYKLACLGQEIIVSIKNRDIIGSSPLGGFLVEEIGEYSSLSILRYLIHAKNMPLSGELVKPDDLPGGDFFSKGSHVLPIEKIIRRFENDFNGFIETGIALGGSLTEYGDVSLRLPPFPRLPVYIIIWAGDDEFPAKSSLLFDSSCTSHAATDILWSTAVMTIEMMLSSRDRLFTDKV